MTARKPSRVIFALPLRGRSLASRPRKGVDCSDRPQSGIIEKPTAYFRVKARPNPKEILSLHNLRFADTFPITGDARVTQSQFICPAVRLLKVGSSRLPIGKRCPRCGESRLKAFWQKNRVKFRGKRPPAAENGKKCEKWMYFWRIELKTARFLAFLARKRLLGKKFATFCFRNSWSSKSAHLLRKTRKTAKRGFWRPPRV